MKQLMWVAAALAAVSGCAGQTAREQLNIADPAVARGGFGTPQDAAAGAALKSWTDVYTPVKRRAAALDALQSRLERDGAKKATYAGAAAQCWIDAGREELARRDEWGFVEEAIGAATALVDGLDAGDGRTVRAPALRTTVRVRPDLWDELASLQADARFAHCAPAQQRAACAQVGLMHAGHEAWTRAFSDAQQRVVAVQVTLRDAARALSACAAPVAAPVAAPAQVIALPADTLFAFDRGDLAALSAAGRAELERLAAQLRGQQQVGRLQVSGYSDRLGSRAYNLRLSQQRAQTVTRLLRGLGVSVPIDTRGLGSVQPGTVCAVRARAELIGCLAPDRRVEIRVVGALPGAARGSLRDLQMGAPDAVGIAAATPAEPEDVHGAALSAGAADQLRTNGSRLGN